MLFRSDSLARVTGKEFAESLRRRAARKREEEKLEIEDMSTEPEPMFDLSGWNREDGYLSAQQQDGWGTQGSTGIEIDGQDRGNIPYGEETEIPPIPPEIHVYLDVEYFKWKEEGEKNDEKKERRFPFKKH